MRGILSPGAERTRATGTMSHAPRRGRSGALRSAGARLASTSAHRNHFVMHTLRDERWLTDTPQVRKALAREVLPFAKHRYLGTGDLRSGDRLPILCTQHQPASKCFSRPLARRRGRKESLLQDCVALNIRIVEIAGQAGLLQVHNVLATTRRRPDQDHSPRHRRSIQHHLLRDHSAQRASEHVAAFDTEAVEKCERVPRHSGHGLRHRSCGPADTGAIEQDDISC
jgi:hypothetical protein